MSWTQKLEPLGRAARVLGVLALIFAGLAALLVAPASTTAQGQTNAGRDMVLTDIGSRQAFMSWINTGSPAATSLSIVRFLPDGTSSTTALAANATNFTGAVPAGQGLACWQTFAQPGDARSDILCLVPDVNTGLDVGGSAVGLAATGMTITAQQTIVTTTIWTPSGGITSQIFVPLGTPRFQTLGPVANFAIDNTGGSPTCNLVLSLLIGLHVGTSNAVCAIVGVSSLPPPPPTATRTNTPNVTATPIPPTATQTFTPSASPTPSATPTRTNTPTATNTPTPPDLTISKVGSPATQNAGGTVTFTITVTNNGQLPATNAEVLDPAPAGMTWLSANGGASFVCGDPSGTQILSCTAGTPLAGGASASITLVALINNPCIASPIVNTAQVDPSNLIVESNETNNFGTASISVIGCATKTPTITPTAPTATATLVPTNLPTATATGTPVTDLTIIKIVNPTAGPAAPGGTIQYTIQVTNNGPLAVSGVTVTDVMDVPFNFNVGFLSAAGSNGFTCVGVSTGFAFPFLVTVTCTGGSIGANGGATINIVATTFGSCAPVGIVNLATVDPANTIAENNEGNNTASLQLAEAGCAAPVTLTPTVPPTLTLTPTPTTIPAGGFTITKSGAPNPFTPGQIVVWTVKLTNTSGGTMTNVSFQDVFPAGLAAIPAITPAGTGFSCFTIVGTTVRCSGGTIQNNQTVTFTASITITTTNTACLAAALPTPNIVNMENPPVVNNAVSASLVCVTATATATPVGFDLDVLPGVLTVDGVAASYTSTARFPLAQDGTGGFITGITVTGSVGGTAPRNALTNASIVVVPGAGQTFTGLPQPWSCIATGPSTWSCTGSVGPDTTNGGNDAFIPASLIANIAFVDVTVTGTGAAAAETVTYTTTAPSCGVPSPCTSGVATPANFDGLTLTYAVVTDTL